MWRLSVLRIEPLIVLSRPMTVTPEVEAAGVNADSAGLFGAEGLAGGGVSDFRSVHIAIFRQNLLRSMGEVQEERMPSGTLVGSSVREKVSAF